MSDNLDGYVSIRINKVEFEKFKTKCDEVLGNSYQVVIRDLMQAFVEERMTIIPTEQQKKLKQFFKG